MEEDHYSKAARAHALVAAAVKSGNLEKKPCEVCGSSRSQGHHDDYDRPLEVMWLCKKHHVEEHAKYGRVLPKGKSLNIRDFPPQLIVKLKIKALGKNTSLRATIIELLSEGEIQAEPIWGEPRYYFEEENKQRVRCSRNMKSVSEQDRKERFTPSGSTPAPISRKKPVRVGADPVVSSTEMSESATLAAMDAMNQRCAHRFASICEDCLKVKKGNI